MTWRNNAYYRSRRTGNRVRAEYVASGYIGYLLLQKDLSDQVRQQAEQEAWQAEMAKQDALDQEIDAVGRHLQALVDAAFLVAGYHTHKRQWRKQRHGGNEGRV